MNWLPLYLVVRVPVGIWQLHEHPSLILLFSSLWDTRGTLSTMVTSVRHLEIILHFCSCALLPSAKAHLFHLEGISNLSSCLHLCCHHLPLTSCWLSAGHLRWFRPVWLIDPSSVTVHSPKNSRLVYKVCPWGLCFSPLKGVSLNTPWTWDAELSSLLLINEMKQKLGKTTWTGS